MFLKNPDTLEAAAYREQERASTGYLMNLERLWAWRPDAAHAMADQRQQLMHGSTLTLREFAVLVCAGARAAGDSYCALGWASDGSRLQRAGPDTLLGPRGMCTTSGSVLLCP